MGNVVMPTPKVTATHGKEVVTGLASLIKSLRYKRQEHAKGISRGLKKAGAFLKTESQKLVPVDTGNLKASAFVESEGKGYDTVVTVGYDSEQAYYAIYVHENMNVHHPIGQAKFLEQPARQRRREMMEIVRREVRKGK